MQHTCDVRAASVQGGLAAAAAEAAQQQEDALRQARDAAQGMGALQEERSAHAAKARAAAQELLVGTCEPICWVLGVT